MKRSPLILPRRKIITPCVSGRYRLMTRKRDGRLVDDTGWFDNLVLDAGLNRMGSGGTMTRCQVGTGSTAPEVTDSSLESILAATSTVFSDTWGAQSTEPYFGYNRRTFRFAEGVAAGNISEVGVGWGDSGSLFSRALVLDSEGDPTTITVLSDEVLDVVYERRLYPPAADSNFAVEIGETEYNCTCRPALITSNGWGGNGLATSGVRSIPGGFAVTAYAGAIGGVTGSPSGTQSSLTNGVPSDYENNSQEIEVTYSATLTQGNLTGGIKSILLNHGGGLGIYQIEFDEPLPKDNTKVLSFKSLWSWDRRSI